MCEILSNLLCYLYKIIETHTIKKRFKLYKAYIHGAQRLSAHSNPFSCMRPVVADAAEEAYVFDFGQMKGKTVAAALEAKPDYVAYLIAGGHLANRPVLSQALAAAGVLESETGKAQAAAKFM